MKPVARRASHLPSLVTCRAPLPYRGNHPRPPPNKYNASFGKKCVTNAHATFFVTFDDSINDCIQMRCILLVQGPGWYIFQEIRRWRDFSRAPTAARVWPPYQTVAMACFPTGKRLAGLEILAGLEGLEEIRPTVLLPTMPRPMTHVPPMRAFHVPRPMSHVPAMRAFHVQRPLSHVSPMRGGGGIFLHGHDGADGAAPSHTRFPWHGGADRAAPSRTRFLRASRRPGSGRPTNRWRVFPGQRHLQAVVKCSISE